MPGRFRGAYFYYDRLAGVNRTFERNCIFFVLLALRGNSSGRGLDNLFAKCSARDATSFADMIEQPRPSRAWTAPLWE